jgi:protein-histidine pros-kinase
MTPRLTDLPPEERSRLLSRAAHDLRGPLNAILGFAGTLLLRLPGPLTADQEQQLGAIRGSARDLLRLIDRLVELAQVEGGELRRAPGRVDAGALLGEVAAKARDAAAERGVIFDVQGSGTLETDVRLVRRIMEELTDNAARFGGPGVVRLSAAGRRLSVADGGPGIAPADRERLFRPFGPLGARATRDREGPGVGLYLAARLAALVGATIEVGGGPGAGCIFTLSLPEG